MAHWRIERIKNFLIKKTEEILFSGKTANNNNDILLLKLDKLGDYVLFRNFIEEAYKHHHGSGKLILCGNIAWKELAEKLDGQFIDKFIWVDVNRLGDYLYRFSVYKEIRKKNCRKMIYCSYSRTEEFDKIVMHSGAKETIGFCGDDTNMPAETKKINDAQYILLVPGSEECMFEFYRNKLFFEYIFKAKIQVDKPFIKMKKPPENGVSPYIVIFPGAGHETRRWSTSNFAALCVLLFQLYKLPIYVCGADNESKYAEEIISLSDKFVINKTGKYSLSETIGVIQNASAVVTNDSGPLHMAMAVGTPTVCISNGNHFERFCPYPKEMNMPLVTIFPDEFEVKIKTDVMRNSMRCRGSEININTISPEKVMNAINNSRLLRYA